MTTLTEMAVEVLSTADGREKTALSHAHAATWFAARAAGEDIPLGAAKPPLRPARPEKPKLLDPREVPRGVLRAIAPLEDAVVRLLSACVRVGRVAIITNAEAVPPTAEHRTAAPTALPAMPLRVIGYPSNAVGAFSGAPGILNRMAVIAPPYVPVQ